MESGLPKLAWVAAPLLVALAVLAWQALRGRTPTRLALNVWASLLLLVYLLATAGLGVFWVAQQQLPVFDWHYLFGYGTLLLLGLHLWLNLGVVWRYLVRRVRPPAGASAQPQPLPAERVPGSGARRGPTRRAVTAVGAAGAAVGVAGWLGWRQGHEAGRLAVLQELGAGSAGLAPGRFVQGGPDPAALALVERFHALSSSVRRGGVPGAPPVSWGNPPPPFKRVSGDGVLPLPAPLRAADASASPLTALATALWHTSAVTLERGTLALRASPSSGALFATELYLITRDLPGLPAGAWHYDVRAHALVPLPTVGDPTLASVTGSAVGNAAAAVVATGIFRRTGYKYRDRAYRYMLADLGHALENLRLASGAAGLPLRFLQGFDEGGLASALGLDAAEEGVLMLARLGADDGLPLAGLPPRTDFVPVTGSALGVTHVIHQASRWRGPVPSTGLQAAVPSAPVNGLGDPLALIAGRRSRRRYAPQPLPAGASRQLLVALQADRPLLSSAVRVHLVVHTAADLAPGVWRWDPARRELIAHRTDLDLRRASRAAALDQDVIGDAAAVLVLALDRATWTSDAGGPARGYRHGLLEAGLVGERWYLQSEALGLGACGVGAFFDDEVAALVGVDPAQDWVVHLAAVGVPTR